MKIISIAYLILILGSVVFSVTFTGLSWISFGRNLLYSGIFVAIICLIGMNLSGSRGNRPSVQLMEMSKKAGKMAYKEQNQFLSIALAGVLAIITGYLIAFLWTENCQGFCIYGGINCSYCCSIQIRLLANPRSTWLAGTRGIFSLPPLYRYWFYNEVKLVPPAGELSR